MTDEQDTTENTEWSPAMVAALLQEAAAELADRKTAAVVPNRAEKRRLGSRSGFYRMPRTQPRGTGTETHWLNLERSIREEAALRTELRNATEEQE